jgi:hypothetical protein
MIDRRTKFLGVLMNWLPANFDFFISVLRLSAALGITSAGMGVTVYALR